MRAYGALICKERPVTHRRNEGIDFNSSYIKYFREVDVKRFPIFC